MTISQTERSTPVSVFDGDALLGGSTAAAFHSCCWCSRLARGVRCAAATHSRRRAQRWLESHCANTSSYALARLALESALTTFLI
jgi:hypothetical protein